MDLLNLIVTTFLLLIGGMSIREGAKSDTASLRDEIRVIGNTVVEEIRELRERLNSAEYRIDTLYELILREKLDSYK